MLLLVDGAVLVVDDWVVAGAVAAGVWLLLLFGSGVVLDVCASAIPADSSKAEHVTKNFFIGLLLFFCPAPKAGDPGCLHAWLAHFPLRQLEMSY